MNEIRNGQFSFLRANQEKIQGEVDLLESNLEVYHKRLHSVEDKVDGIYVLINGDPNNLKSEGLRQITMKILERCQSHQLEKDKKKSHWSDFLKYIEKTIVYFSIGYLFLRFVIRG